MIIFLLSTSHAAIIDDIFDNQSHIDSIVTTQYLDASHVTTHADTRYSKLKEWFGKSRVEWSNNDTVIIDLYKSLLHALPAGGVVIDDTFLVSSLFEITLQYPQFRGYSERLLSESTSIRSLKRNHHYIDEILADPVAPIGSEIFRIILLSKYHLVDIPREKLWSAPDSLLLEIHPLMALALDTTRADYYCELAISTKEFNERIALLDTLFLIDPQKASEIMILHFLENITVGREEQAAAKIYVYYLNLFYPDEPLFSSEYRTAKEARVPVSVDFEVGTFLGMTDPDTAAFNEYIRKLSLFSQEEMGIVPIDYPDRIHYFNR